VPTKTSSRSRPSYSYTTTEGYSYRKEDPKYKNALYGGQLDNEILPPKF
jgi:hypothetical protein